MFGYVPKELNWTSTKKLDTPMEKNKSVITSMNGKELERINVTITCDKEADKHKEMISAYDSKDKGKASRMSENKENVDYGYIHMYERGK